jgi:hypothetical protein
MFYTSETIFLRTHSNPVNNMKPNLEKHSLISDFKNELIFQISDRDRFFGSYDTSRLLGGTRGLGLDPYQLSNNMKPRMRICFDPETELPKLQKWFKENNHPTRQQVSLIIGEELFNSGKLINQSSLRL